MLRRSVARAGALTLVAAALAACNDSTGPRAFTTEELEAVGDAVAFEIEGAVGQLTADGAMGSTEEPAFSFQSHRSRVALSRAAARLQRSRATPTAQVSGSECGVPSQDPPTDTDADGVPDNLTITFALPACHVVDDVNGTTMDMTGTFRISDPTPGTAGMALSFGLTNLRIAFSGPDFSGVATRDGSATVAASETGLSQTHNWRETAVLHGYPGISANLDWTATFAAAQGQSIVTGEPLPDGVYQPNGSVRYQVGNAAAELSVTTTVPLQYSASCAAGIEAGTADTPFTSGQVRVAFSGVEGQGYVTVTYANCDVATVLYVNQQQ